MAMKAWLPSRMLYLEIKMKMKSFYRVTFSLLVALWAIGCGHRDGSEENDISRLYLPNLNLLYDDYEQVDSTKAYSRLAYKLLHENRDLRSSQMYVDAAWFYDKAGIPDSVAQVLHWAIDRGMANPKILQKFSLSGKIPEGPLWESLQRRLDSIQDELKDVTHFSIEVDAMNQFWPYFDRAIKDSTRALSIFKEYIFEGPQEIRDFYYARYENPSNMYGQMINATPEYYLYLKNYLQTDSLIMLDQKITGWMRNFKTIYPQAVFPKVFVVPGILNTGGTATEMGMFVGGDMYGRSDSMPTEGLSDWQRGAIMRFSDLPGLTLHELMHFQQSYRDSLNQETVLMQIIGEGVCDFLAELSSGKPLSNENLDYLEDSGKKDFILKELKKDLFSKDNSRWLYNGGSIEDRPHDLGYTMGYLISKSYYENHADKKTAVYELLNTDDVVSILSNSDYNFLLKPDYSFKATAP